VLCSTLEGIFFGAQKKRPFQLNTIQLFIFAETENISANLNHCLLENCKNVTKIFSKVT
jgi:hypothetical protein